MELTMSHPTARRLIRLIDRLDAFGHAVVDRVAWLLAVVGLAAAAVLLASGISQAAGPLR
jgi:hypothetical protein